MNHQIEEPLSLWSEIIPNLWVGGTEDFDVINVPKRLSNFNEKKMFDTVVSLYAYSQPVGWQVKEIRYGFGDGPLGTEDEEELNKLARWTYEEYKLGKKIGIRCQMGINRSAYVAGKLLVMLGYKPIDAITLIRSKRSKFALNNRYFEKALLTG